MPCSRSRLVGPGADTWYQQVPVVEHPGRSRIGVPFQPRWTVTAEACTAKDASQRVVSIDALRGIAAFAVVIHHYLSRYDLLYGHKPGFDYRFDSGQYGVHLFFMISGFVIFMTLSQTRHALDFMVARGSRLYPGYWAAVLLTSAALWLFPLPDAQVDATRVLVNLTMLQKVFGYAHIDQVYWTLSVELAFYGAMLIAWLAGLLRHPIAFASAWLAWELVVIVAVRAKVFDGVPGVVEATYLRGYAHLFIAGMLFHLVFQRRGGWMHHALIAVCCCTQLLMGGWQSFFITAPFYLIFYALALGRVRILESRLLIFAGAISYAVYLLHDNIGFIIIRSGYEHGIHPWISIGIATATTVLLASVVTFAIERPALQAARAAWKRSRESITAHRFVAWLRPRNETATGQRSSRTS